MSLSARMSHGLCLFLFSCHPLLGPSWQINSNDKCDQVQLCHLPALVVNFVILANKILETHVLPPLLLLIEEALAPRHIEHSPHSSLGQVLVL